MKAGRVCSLFLLVAAAGQPNARALERGVDSSARVAPAVELALVLTALSPLGEDDEHYDPIRRSGAYYTEVLEHFADFRKHPAVTALGRHFNMPRLVGNAADFDFDPDGELVESNSEGSLWGDEQGDLFRKHLTKIQEFSNRSGFLSFFEEHHAAYESYELATDRLIDLEDMSTWLESQFTARPNRAEIYVSPLIDSHHWTSGTHQPTLRIWVRPASPSPGREVSTVDRLLYGRSVFTELDHPYVNPVSAQLSAAIEAALSDRELWGSERAWDDYSSAEAVFNEYMTYAVFLLYARDRLPSMDEFLTLHERTIVQMEEGRGFVRFGAFADQLLMLADSHEGIIEELFESAIEWCSAEGE